MKSAFNSASEFIIFIGSFFSKMVNNKAVIVKHYLDLGITDIKDIQERSGLSYNTIKYNLGKIEKNGTTDHLPRSGRPTKIDQIKEVDIQILLDTQQASSAKKIKETLNSLHSDEVSTSTVQRYLKKTGHVYKLPKSIPNLTPAHIQKRIEWGKLHSNFKWKNVIFSDETSIQLHQNTIKFWTPADVQKFKTCPKFTPKIFLWGAISLFGRSELHIINGIMTGESYVEILQGCLLPFGAQMPMRRWIFQQDNDPKHTSRVSKSFIRNSVPKLLPWPANSPDLNPIENVWQMLKYQVEIRNPTSLEELKRYSIEEWAQIPQESINNCILSMPNRINELLEAKGHKINY